FSSSYMAFKPWHNYCLCWRSRACFSGHHFVCHGAWVLLHRSRTLPCAGVSVFFAIGICGGVCLSGYKLASMVRRPRSCHSCAPWHTRFAEPQPNGGAMVFALSTYFTVSGAMRSVFAATGLAHQKYHAPSMPQLSHCFNCAALLIRLC